jgi:hypothetical protein
MVPGAWFMGSEQSMISAEQSSLRQSGSIERLSWRMIVYDTQRKDKLRHVTSNMINFLLSKLTIIYN